MRYYAYFSINCGATGNAVPYEFTSKREAIKFIRSLCRESLPAGASGAVSVYADSDDTQGSKVYSATITNR